MRSASLLFIQLEENLFLTGPLCVVDLVSCDGADDCHWVIRPGAQVEGRLRVHNVAGNGISIPGGRRVFLLHTSYSYVMYAHVVLPGCQH